MSIELNHTIVHARDPLASAIFLAEMLGRPAPVRFGPFWDVELDKHVTLAYILADEHLTIEHYAFLVSEEEFDRIFERIQARGAAVLGGPGAPAAGPHQPPRWRARRLLERPQWPHSGDHHAALRQRQLTASAPFPAQATATGS